MNADTCGIYVRGDSRDYVSNSEPMRLKIGRAENIGRRDRTHITSSIYAQTIYRIYSCRPEHVVDFETAIHKMLKREGLWIQEPRVSKELFHVSLDHIDEITRWLPGLDVENRWVDPKDDNRRWPKHVKLASFYWMKAYAPGQRAPKAERARLLPVLEQVFPIEMATLSEGRTERTLYILGQRLQMMHTPGTTDTEHPDNWPDRDVQEDILWRSGWGHYPADALI